MAFDPGSDYVLPAMIAGGYDIAPQDVAFECRRSNAAYATTEQILGGGACLSFFCSLATFGAVGSISVLTMAPVVGLLALGGAAWRVGARKETREAERRLIANNPAILTRVQALLDNGHDDWDVSRCVTAALAEALQYGSRKMPDLVLGQASEVWDGDGNAFNDPIAPQTPPPIAPQTPPPIAPQTPPPITPIEPITQAPPPIAQPSQLRQSQKAFKLLSEMACAPLWVVGPSQVGKSALSSAYAEMLLAEGFSIWFVNLGRTEVSPVEALCDRVAVCNIDCDPVEDVRGAIVAATAMLEDLRSASYTVLIFDEFSVVAESVNPLLTVLMGAFGETVKRTRSSGPKRSQGLFCIGTPIDIRQVNPKLKNAIGSLRIVPFLSSQIRTARGVSSPSPTDLQSVLGMAGLEFDDDLAAQTSSRVIHLGGCWHGIDDVCEYKPHVAIGSSNRKEPVTTAIGFASSPPPIAPPSPVRTMVAVGADDFDDF
jgi:hypothetical protein